MEREEGGAAAPITLQCMPVAQPRWGKGGSCERSSSGFLPCWALGPATAGWWPSLIQANSLPFVQDCGQFPCGGGG